MLESKYAKQAIFYKQLYVNNILYLKICLRIERFMLSIFNIPQLITHNFRAINVYFRHITVRMSINPIIYVAVINKIVQFGHKRAIYAAVFKFFCQTQNRWHMMTDNNLLTIVICRDRIFQKRYSLLMYLIEV